MKKNIILCTFSILVGMAGIGFYSAYITKVIIEKKSFEIRTKKEFLELSYLTHQNYNGILFQKSIFLFGSIIQIKNDNFHLDNIFCSNISEGVLSSIIKTIEKRTTIPYKEKQQFKKGSKFLIESCKSRGSGDANATLNSIF